jgi:hypothetical protein
VRSTLIVSSIQALRTHGYFDAYLAQLGPLSQEMISLIAGVWIPLDLGLEHYRAADRLGLDTRIIDGLGADVSERISKTMWAFVVRVSRETGVNPWTALARAHRLRENTWKGSDCAVLKLGPKEARFDWVGLPYAAVPYYVTAFGGFLRGIMCLFSKTAYTRVVPERCSPTSISYRISWV